MNLFENRFFSLSGSRQRASRIDTRWVNILNQVTPIYGYAGYIPQNIFVPSYSNFLRARITEREDEIAQIGNAEPGADEVILLEGYCVYKRDIWTCLNAEDPDSNSDIIRFYPNMVPIPEKISVDVVLQDIQNDLQANKIILSCLDAIQSQQSGGTSESAILVFMNRVQSTIGFVTDGISDIYNTAIDIIAGAGNAIGKISTLIKSYVVRPSDDGNGLTSDGSQFTGLNPVLGWFTNVNTSMLVEGISAIVSAVASVVNPVFGAIADTAIGVGKFIFGGSMKKFFNPIDIEIVDGDVDECNCTSGWASDAWDYVYPKDGSVQRNWKAFFAGRENSLFAASVIGGTVYFNSKGDVYFRPLVNSNSDDALLKPRTWRDHWDPRLRAELVFGEVIADPGALQLLQAASNPASKEDEAKVVRSTKKAIILASLYTSLVSLAYDQEDAWFPFAAGLSDRTFDNVFFLQGGTRPTIKDPWATACMSTCTKVDAQANNITNQDFYNLCSLQGRYLYDWVDSATQEPHRSVVYIPGEFAKFVYYAIIHPSVSGQTFPVFVPYCELPSPLVGRVSIKTDADNYRAVDLIMSGLVVSAAAATAWVGKKIAQKKLKVKAIAALREAQYSMTSGFVTDKEVLKLQRRANRWSKITGISAPVYGSSDKTNAQVIAMIDKLVTG